MKTFFSIILSLFLINSFSQKTQNVGDFNSIEVYDQINAELIPSDRNFVEISGKNSESVQVINKNNTLKIRMKLDQFLKGEQTTVKIYYNTIYKIAVKEGASLSSAQPVSTPSLSLNANKGGLINLNVNTNSIDARLDSGGVIEISGEAGSQDIVCNSGGYYDGKQLRTKTTNVTVNAGGNSEIYATDYVNAKTRAGGNIEIYGNPEVDQKTVAGGNIKIR